MNETVLTVVGNVASDPTLRVTTSGVKVTSFRLASTERRFDKGLGAWRDGDTLFWWVSCWRALGENVADSVEKGQPVVVHGRLRERVYDVDGQRRSSLDIDAVVVGHDLSRGVAEFRKAAGVTREAPPLPPGDDEPGGGLGPTSGDGPADAHDGNGGHAATAGSGTAGSGTAA